MFLVDLSIGIPRDIQLLASTTTTLTIGWTVSDNIIIITCHAYVTYINSYTMVEVVRLFLSLSVMCGPNNIPPLDSHA